MGRITLEFRGLKIEVSLDDAKVEGVYNLLPAFALEKGQVTLEAKPKPEVKPLIQKPLVREVTKYPSREEIYAFIKSKPNYEFSLPLICRNFLGFVPSSVLGKGNTERRYYDRMWEKTNKVKKMIAKEESGEWKQREGEERETIYRFEKPNQEA